MAAVAPSFPPPLAVCRPPPSFSPKERQANVGGGGNVGERAEKEGAGAAYRIRLRVFPDPQAAAAPPRLFVFLRYGLLYTLPLRVQACAKEMFVVQTSLPSTTR